MKEVDNETGRQEKTGKEGDGRAERENVEEVKTITVTKKKKSQSTRALWFVYSSNIIV